jgi:2-polyprenyl-3-methyl-5-hydroxy-6-metoxy-1,4-benzoquinol methylase
MVEFNKLYFATMRIQRKKISLYESFHDGKKLQKRIIGDDNFTYGELIKILKPYLKDCHTILDIGSGVGTIDFYLAKKGKDVTGIEISTKAVNLAKKNAKLFNLSEKIKFIVAKFPDKVPSKQYDLVILSEVIEHLKDDSKTLRDIRGVLKPKGLLVITTPSKNAPLYRLGLLNEFDKSVGHLRRYSTDDLLNLLNNNNYQVINFGRHEGILRNFLFTNSVAGKILRFVRWKISDIVTFADRIMLMLFGESNLWVIAKKI